MKLAFAGGAMEVGGSCILLRTEEYGILMDCGIRQGTGKDPIPDFRLIQELGGADVILISHAHMDHIGTLPMISRAYPSARIYMTPMTMDLTRVLLLDSLKIMAMQEEEIPHYVEGDVEAMMDRITPLHYSVEREILPGIHATFYPAGHIAGAACIHITTPEGSVFYSGDYAAFPQRTIEGIRIPRLRPDVVITEATYGDKLHANRQVEEKRLIRLVGEAVQKGSKVLIPSFALGRAQEVILLVREGMQNGDIPKVPVYVDGMVRDICRVYKTNPTYLRGRLARSILKGNEPFYTDEIRAVLLTDDRKALLEAKGPAIFIASSGMLSGGPSVLYAETLAMQPDALILITGYQDEEAPGRTLIKLMEEKEAEEEAPLDKQDEGPEVLPTINLNGKVIPVRAQVARVGLSAHGDQSEILGLLGQLSPRAVCLVHGDPDIIRQLAPHVTGEHLRQLYAPDVGEVVDLKFRTIREQLGDRLPYIMHGQVDQETGLPTQEGQRALWHFVTEHYPKRELSAVQLIRIYTGTAPSENTDINSWQSMLLDSVYFAPNPSRLFLFHPRTLQEVEELLTPKEKTQQEISVLAEEAFAPLGYKRIGYYMDKKELVLFFTFPDAVDRESVQAAIQTFTENTGFTVSISPSTNHAEATRLLMQFFSDRLLRYAYFETQKIYRVQLAGTEPEDEERRSTFEKTTGWKLLFGEEESPESQIAQTQVLPSRKAMEQNAAQAYVRTATAYWSDRVYKIGIKNDSTGRYMELGFLTPQLAARHIEDMQMLTEDTGWRMKSAQSVMQNLLLPLCSEICASHGVNLKKTPSYMPAEQQVQLRPVAADDAQKEA
ncbi:MAG: MBL fold metallo-hydrolase, partial [Clostridia bacterium]|nr:MBL fold metallo-hydrolase [Clostridia bacterium]